MLVAPLNTITGRWPLVSAASALTALIMASTGISSLASLPIVSALSSFSLSSHLNRYREKYEFALTENWDGEGALALSPEILHVADQILRSLPQELEPTITPGIDGSLALSWGDEDNYIYVDIGPGDVLHLYYDIRGFGQYEFVSRNNNPELLLKIRAALTHSLGFDENIAFGPAYSINLVVT